MAEMLIATKIRNTNNVNSKSLNIFSYLLFNSTLSSYQSFNLVDFLNIFGHSNNVKDTATGHCHSKSDNSHTTKEVTKNIQIYVDGRNISHIMVGH